MKDIYVLLMGSSQLSIQNPYSTFRCVKKTILDLVVALLVEWANLDADRAAVIFRKIWEAFTVIEYGDQPIVMLDWIFIKCFWWAVTDTALAYFTEI